MRDITFPVADLYSDFIVTLWFMLQKIKPHA